MNKASDEYSSNDAIQDFKVHFAKFNINNFCYEKLDPYLQLLYDTPQRTAYLLLEDYCNQIGDPNRLALCCVDYLNLDYFQAIATKNNTFHHIGVSYVVPPLVQTLFQQLVRDTNLFSITNFDYQRQYQFPLTLPMMDEQQTVEKNIELMLLDTMPQERWQKILSTKLSELAVLFCFCHEIAHHTLGHCALSNTRKPLGVMEVSTIVEEDVQGKHLSSKIQQSWELQADRAALGMLLSYVFNNDNYRARLTDTLLCTKDKPTESLLARLLYAISFVFFLFGQNQRNVDSASTHPSSIVRLTYASAHLVTLGKKKFPNLDEETLTQMMELTIAKAENAWNQMDFSFGDYQTENDELLKVVQRLNRYDMLALRFLSHHQWY